jgi:hypothetical protein
MDGQDLAERVRLDQFARLVERGMIAELETDEDLAATLLRGLL